MAKIKLQGHASGSGIITLTAPNTSTDRVITLPDATATIATTADVTAATFNPDAAQVFNESGADVDFRVESDSNAFMLMVQGEYNSVGIGVNPKISGNNDTDFTSLQIGGNANIYAHTPASNGHSIVVAQNVYNGNTNKYIVTDEATRYYQQDGKHVFDTAASGSADAAISWNQALEIRNDTTVRLKSNTHALAGVEETLNVNCFRDGNGNDKGIFISGNTAGGGTHSSIRFYNNVHGVNGSITHGATSTAYNTSSDYRLKENVDYTWDATTRLKQLKPARFNWIVDDTNTLVDGFIAHEVSSVVPEAIHGIKDAMTAEVLYVEGDELPEGKSVGDVKEASVIEPQGIDQSKLVPLLVKTIQELEARITALEA